MKRGYGQPHEKTDSGASDDDDMSDEGTDDTDTLPSTSRPPSDAAAAASSSAAAAASSSHNRIEFYIGNHLLPYDMTVYQVRIRIFLDVFGIDVF